MKKILTLMLVATTLVVLAACGGNDEKKVNLSYVSWAEGIAMTNLAAVILEDELDYEVELTLVDVGPAFTSVASGDADAFMDVWVPTTHAAQMEEYGDDVVDLGASYVGAKIGLIVPKYVYDAGIQSIADLEGYAGFDGEITGIDSGAGIMTAAENAITDYNLTGYELLSSSEAAMIAALDVAYKNEEPIVITGWAPHWKFGSYDLEFLADPEGTFGGAEEIRTIVRDGLEEDKPEVYAFLDNFEMSDADLSDLMVKMNEKSDNVSELDVARTWANAHTELVNSWLPEN